MYGYIYKTTNVVTGKIYVGKHKCDHFDTKYYGSGVLLREAITNFGISNFNCDIIDTAESLDELNNKEIYWISVLNARNPMIGYNISEGGCYDGSPLSRTSEGYQRFASSRSIYCQNSKWWTNGVSERFCSECPEGFWKGRSPKSVKRLQEQSSTVSGKIWITDGNHECYIDSADEVPSGWYRGRLPNKHVRKTTHPAWNKGIPNTRLKNTVWVCNKDSRKQVSKDDLKDWIARGYKIGMNYKK